MMTAKNTVRITAVTRTRRWARVARLSVACAALLCLSLTAFALPGDAQAPADSGASTILKSPIQNVTTTTAASAPAVENPGAVAAPPVAALQGSPPLAPTGTPPAPIAASTAAVPAAAQAELKLVIAKLTTGTILERKRYAAAAAEFPSFCSNWQRLLSARTQNNLANLKWQERDGYETTTYTDYSKIESCECKESAEGIPLGKVTYEELSYYLAGRTRDDATHTPPKLVGTTHTLEIFSWDKNKWFY